MKNEHPIIFSTESIKAILNNKKTMTRRIIKPQPVWHSEWGTMGYEWKDKAFVDSEFRNKMINFCSYGKIGDILWVREIWTDWNCCGCRENKNSCACSNKDFFEKFPHYGEIVFKSDYKEMDGVDIGRWKSPMFMPKKYSRIKLEIINIKVERLWDITEEDTIAEGIKDPNDFKEMPSYLSSDHYRLKFEKLWNSINAKCGFRWELNPWIWCISFRHIK